MAERNTMTNEGEMKVERIFDAPLETVWQYWSEPKHFKKWWGPKDFTAPEIRIDFRVTGKFAYCMRGVAAPGAAEQDFWNSGEYLEIIPMKKIAMSMSFADKNGKAVPASYYHMPGDWPADVELTATFENAGDGKTKVTVREVGVPPEMREFSRMGWEQSLEKMAQALAKS